MTHTSTEQDQERAEFERILADEVYGRMPELISDHWDAEKGEYKLFQHQVAWIAWQAARRAPVVPQFNQVAQKKLNYLLEAGEEITGYAIQNKYGRRGAIDCHGFAYWWQDAAAPQPPECLKRENPTSILEAAPVQMPEAEAWRYTTTQRRSYAYRGKRKDFDKEYPMLKPEPLYTEQQVRQLLAAQAKQGEQP